MYIYTYIYIYIYIYILPRASLRRRGSVRLRRECAWPERVRHALRSRSRSAAREVWAVQPMLQPPSGGRAEGRAQLPQ